MVGAQLRVDPELLEAIASVESGGRAGAVSPKGAQGLMQLMPETARRFGVEHPLDARESVLGAARFLSYLREGANIADLPQLLGAYNAGEGAVEHYGGIPPYPETREYVRQVLWVYFLGVSPRRKRNPTKIAGQSLGVKRAILTNEQSGLTNRTPFNLLQRTAAPVMFVPPPSLPAQVSKRPTTDLDVLERMSALKQARARASKWPQADRNRTADKLPGK
jgi:hypothetical protein